jgi:hypothetical protein
VRVLFLGPQDSPILSYLRSEAAEVVNTDDAGIDLGWPDFIVSHGYRHILSPAACWKFARRAVNVHISLLPAGRGASPNAWAWYDGAPHGVTIHFLEALVDSGMVVAQHQVHFGEGETLATSYARLQAEAYRLFCGWWEYGRPIAPLTGAIRETYHSKADTERVITPLLTHGWNTPVSILQEAGKKERAK